VTQVADLVAQTSMNVVQTSFAFERCGLTLIGDLTFEDCLSCAKSIDSVESSKHWWIGDLLNCVEMKYGDKYKEFEEATGFDYETLRGDKYVASRVEFVRRRTNLSFGHHREIAPYEAKEQDILLAKAEEQGLSIKQLRLKKDSLLPKGVEPGQLWKLGRHLLYCGDSSSETFINLCKQSEASFAFADPPYNAGVDVWDVGFEWKHDYLSDVAPVVAVTPGISAIKDFMGNTEMPYQWSMAYWIDNGMTRGALGFGNWIYVALFSEQSLYRNEQDVERIPDSERVSITGGDHETLKHKGRKPISLLSHILSLFTEVNQTVIDPFLGTGTTLIACEREGRLCIGAEVDIEYCEHIIKRWEKEAEQEAEVMEWSQ
jgi:DNA modification methylase